MNNTFLFACAVIGGTVALGAQTTPIAPPKVAPTVDQILSLKRVASPEISPDGRWVAYTVRETNWDDNAYETEIWLADTASGGTRQLTNARKSSQSPAWSPDGSMLAFISDRTDKRQIYLIKPTAGEADALTTLDGGIGSFAWSPDGRSIAYTATEPKSTAIKDREKKYGEFQVVEQDYRMTRLFVIDVATKATRALTSGPFTVGSFRWSPDGKSIAFDHRVNESPSSRGSTDISIVTVGNASIRKLVSQEGPDAHPVWSPDGSRIAFETSMANPAFYYTNSLIATIPASGGTPAVLTAAFDEDPSIVDWKPNGLFFSASQRTFSYLFRLDPDSKAIARLAAADAWVGSSFSLSRDGSKVAFLAADAKTVAEVFVAAVPASAGSARALQATRLTDMNTQTVNWATSTLDVISWKSQDGATIEGVLHKPVGFDPSKKYPLLVVIHGGPTGVDAPVVRADRYYPIEMFAAKGALILRPNYRGSAGYGEKFRSLNVRNLGVGYYWDVISGVDHLIALGIVDRDRVGAMGWSQGGYISAFITCSSDRFKAVSVGAGISDWMTYYANTDITPFTRQYLHATPWDDPEIYKKTSPISYIAKARTPTLIQHGENDRRVPIPN